MRRRTPLTAAACLAVLAVFAPAPAFAHSAPIDEYVALGDSSVAGPLIPDWDTGEPGCLRSTNNWAVEVAAELDVPNLTDVSCSAATAEHMAKPQPLPLGGFAPPQFDALSDSTDLVTTTIGGNDVGLVGEALLCVNLLPEPAGQSCKDRLTSGGVDKLAAKIDAFEPAFGRMLDGIREHAPNARVVVVGYGTYIQPGGCYPETPVWSRDADYLQDTIGRLDDMMARQSAEHGVEFVDIREVTEGRDLCAPTGTRWYESLVPTSPATPLHPNKIGMTGIGEAVAAELR